jgi:hypothetical protein
MNESLHKSLPLMLYSSLLLIFSLLSICVYAQSANYYLSEDFQKKLPDYCNFKPSVTATAKQEVKDLNEAKKIIELLADFPSRYKWLKTIDKSKSYEIVGENSKSKMIYHLEYKQSAASFLGLSEKGVDYYREINNPTRFKGCSLTENKVLKRAYFEYSIEESGGKVYLKRTGAILVDSPLPKSLILNKFKDSNANSLKDTIKDIRTYLKSN